MMFIKPICRSFIILLSICLQLLDGFVSSGNRLVKPSYSIMYVSQIMPPADLTPAVDKFPSLPILIQSKSDSSSPLASITTRGPVPEGPEPFSFVASEVQPLADYVKELVKSENPVLTMAASHFFEQVFMNKNIIIVSQLAHYFFCITETRQKISSNNSRIDC